MSRLHVLVDFENVQPTFEEVAKLAPGVTKVWLFHGPHQVKLAQQFKAAHDDVTAVPISRTGKNALDFHLSFYLGYVAAKHPTGRLTVIANDKGYDPMIVHAKALGFTTQRIGFKVKKVTTAKKAPAAKEAVPVKKKTVAKKAAPAKKAAAKKTASAKKAAPAKKTIPAKKSPAGKAASVQPKASSNPANAQVSRIAKGLAKMGDKRPEKLKSFLRHLESMLGKDAQPYAVQEAVSALEKAGLIQIIGDKVNYIE
jgi:hypothetical protein